MEALPDWPSIPPANICLKLRNREANDTFFREVRAGVQVLTTTLLAVGRSHLEASWL